MLYYKLLRDYSQEFISIDTKCRKQSFEIHIIKPLKLLVKRNDDKMVPVFEQFR